MDNAFATAAYPSLTTAQLREKVASRQDCRIFDETTEKMVRELERRDAVAAGDVSKMTDGERLRAARR